MQFGVGQKWKSYTIEILFTFFHANKMLKPIIAKKTPKFRCTVPIVMASANVSAAGNVIIIAT